VSDGSLAGDSVGGFDAGSPRHALLAHRTSLALHTAAGGGGSNGSLATLHHAAAAVTSPAGSPTFHTRSPPLPLPHVGSGALREHSVLSAASGDVGSPPTRSGTGGMGDDGSPVGLHGGGGAGGGGAASGGGAANNLRAPRLTGVGSVAGSEGSSDSGSAAIDTLIGRMFESDAKLALRPGSGLSLASALPLPLMSASPDAIMPPLPPAAAGGGNVAASLSAATSALAATRTYSLPLAALAPSSAGATPPTVLTPPIPTLSSFQPVAAAHSVPFDAFDPFGTSPPPPLAHALPPSRGAAPPAPPPPASSLPFLTAPVAATSSGGAPASGVPTSGGVSGGSSGTPRVPLVGLPLSLQGVSPSTSWGRAASGIPLAFVPPPTAVTSPSGPLLGSYR